MQICMESMGRKPCSCMQFIKTCYFIYTTIHVRICIRYYKSHSHTVLNTPITHTTPTGNIPEAPMLGTPVTRYKGQNVGFLWCPLKMGLTGHTWSWWDTVPCQQLQVFLWWSPNGLGFHPRCQLSWSVHLSLPWEEGKRRVRDGIRGERRGVCVCVGVCELGKNRGEK